MDGFIYSPLGKGHLSKPPGLRNEGNICYITAVLQCILSVAPLRDCLAQAIWSTGGDQPVLQALETLVVALLVTCKETSYSCESFLATLKTHWQRYRPFEQEDCRVFLQYILDALHEETLYDFRIPTFMVGATVKMMVIQAWASRERSPVSVFFGSLPVRHNVCMNPTCGHSWTVCEPVSFYVTLSLPSGNKCTLQDCLQMWASEEILPDAECPKCPLKGRKSRMMMGRLPPLLIIQLARFTFDERGGRVDRTLVEYGHSLDMKDYTVHGLQSSTSYTLVAVTCHSGGLSSGHYTSFCNRDNRWFHFDDSRVNTTTERRVISSGAYFLWYKINVEKAGDLPLDGDMALVPTADPQNDKGIESPPSQADSQDTYIMSDQAYQVESTGSSDFDEPELRKKGKASPPAHRLGKRKPVKTSHQAGGNVDASKILPQATKKGKKISFHLDTDGICNHTQIDLDVRDPLLEKCDVNGGELNLEALKSHAVVQLERLLKIYGLPSKGNKPELIERLQHHVRRGKGDKLDPGFEGGLWHKRKRARLMEEQNIQSNLPIVPFAGKPWNPFPSVHIPEGFHYLNIIEYFEDIPEMDYSYQKGVVQGDASAPVVPPLHEDTSDDDIDDIEQKGPEMTFADLCRRAIKKCISKGEQFLYSNRLLCMFDLKRDNHYFLKAQVQASMEDKVYGVVIILNVSDGSICTAECSCKAKALKRCGHIAAVFLRLWQHVFTKGFEAVTTTGKQCYWRVSGEGKNPGLLREKQYESRKLLAGRVNFDPRPTAFKTDGPISEEELKEFKEDLEKLTPTCLFLYHLDSGFIPSTVMDSEVVLDLETNEGLLMLTEECSKLLWKLAKKCDGQNRPFEVPNTMGQHTSIIWHQERALCVNPSSAKTFLGLAKDITIIKWMRKKIWLMENFENEAMREGKRLEGTARKKCEAKLKRECNEGYSIIETGLWKNPKYPQMACSPDGLIILAGEQTKLLEIKVLTMVNYSVPIPEDTNEVSKKDGGVKTQDKSTNYYNFKTINPENFEEEMTKEQRSNFYLKRNKEGEIELKPKHQYNYQIQMSLDILELSECILCVYSTTGCLLVTVKYDPFFWEEKRARLIHKHRELIIPEAILGRTKRWLPPVKIMYSEFHEDPTDNYFETGASTKNLPYHVITW